jgi:BlaI family transcriptional regulator, penicillinase repressor
MRQTSPPPPPLSKRERQIMDVLYRRRQATAAEVHAEMENPPTYTTVRGLLRILEEKGHVTHREDGPRYVFSPSTPRERAGASTLTHVVKTFFDGSPTKAMAALLGERTSTPEEIQRLEALIAEKKRSSRRTPPKRRRDI